MMQLNRSGAATKPCLTPLEMVNQSERVLLMRIQLDVSVYSRYFVPSSDKQLLPSVRPISLLTESPALLLYSPLLPKHF